METCLRQFKKAKHDLKDLARDAGYDSAKLNHLLSLLPKMEQMDEESDEEVKTLTSQPQSSERTIVPEELKLRCQFIIFRE